MIKDYYHFLYLSYRGLYSCLKFGRFFLLSMFLISCGKQGVNKGDSLLHGKQISFMLMEGQCAENSTELLGPVKDIENLFFEEKLRHPQNFFFISPRHYSDREPLILSLEKMERAFNQLKDDPLLGQRAQELYSLYTESRRYEDQKCQFQQLAKKMKNDIRSHLNLAQFCLEKYQKEICPDQEYIGMLPERESWVRRNAVNLCRSFSGNVNCEVEYRLHLMKNTVGKMIEQYSHRFQKERYEALFKLNPNHQKFRCQSLNDKTIMSVKVHIGAFELEGIEDLLEYVEKVWQNKGFSIKLELVQSYAADAVTILPSFKGISYVPENNNRLIYLSTEHDLLSTKRELAHEFGHVLGFPDCYIEFFDQSKKELIYYEISKEARNIMCSLRDDVRVQEDYFAQLVENSCLFN